MPLVLKLEDGSLIVTQAIQPAAGGFWVSNPDESANTYLLPADKKIVLLQRTTGNQPPIFQTLVCEENRLSLALLKIDQWVVEYAQREAVPGITIFGSGCLNLTILPKRVSHDLDIATTQRFVTFVHQKMIHEPSHDEFRNLEFNPVEEEIAFEFMKGWKRRCATFLGSGGHHYQVLHPIDCLHQKLLRTASDVFEKKDKPDVAAILAVIKPDEDTIITIFKGGALRYTDPDTEIAAIRRSNTEWFLRTYYPQVDLDLDIIRGAVRDRRREIREIEGTAPLRHKEWGDLVQPKTEWKPHSPLPES